MATNAITSRAKTGSPANVVQDPRAVPGVPPGTQSTTRSLQSAISAATSRPRLGANLQADIAALRSGVPAALLERQAQATTEVEPSRSALESMIPFEERAFTGRRPEFNLRSVTQTLPMLMVLSSLGGSRTRVNSLGMIKAMTGAMKGLQTGNRRAYEQALFDYDQNFKEFQQREEVRRKQYDILKNAARDGLQLAIQRKADADKAVNDYDEALSKNLQTQTTLAENARRLLQHNADARTAATTVPGAVAPPVGTPIDEKTRVKREERYGTASTTVESNVRALLEQINAVDRLINHPGLQDMTGRYLGVGDGTVGSFLSDDAMDAKVIYDFILAKGTFASLADIRAASTTGGALGNVSDKDINLLKGSVGAIGTRQRASSMKDNLRNYRRNLQYVVGKIVNAFNTDYGYDPLKVIDKNKLEADILAMLPPVVAPSTVPAAASPTIQRVGRFEIIPEG